MAAVAGYYVVSLSVNGRLAVAWSLSLIDQAYIHLNQLFMLVNILPYNISDY